MRRPQGIWLSTRQAAEELGLTQRQVQGLIGRGRLDAVQTGKQPRGCWRVRRDVLAQYKAERVSADA